MQGKAIIVSAPSGAGKTTIVKHLLAADTEKPSEGTTPNRCFTSVVFPAPEGAETMIAFPFIFVSPG
jgi:ribose 1,5-bisphosphokinase PhnN